MSIFVDTGAFYALADKSDRSHDEAKSYYGANYQPGLFVTSDYVFVESWTLIHHRLGREAARRFWETIRANVFLLQRTTTADLERAWEIANLYHDQDFSLVDCVSFAIMERLESSEAFAFDVHFSIFRPKSGTAFQIYPA